MFVCNNNITRYDVNVKPNFLHNTHNFSNYVSYNLVIIMLVIVIININ